MELSGQSKEFTIKELAELVIDMAQFKSNASLPVLIQRGHATAWPTWSGCLLATPWTSTLYRRHGGATGSTIARRRRCAWRHSWHLSH